MGIRLLSRVPLGAERRGSVRPKRFVGFVAASMVATFLVVASPPPLSPPPPADALSIPPALRCAGVIGVQALKPLGPGEDAFASDVTESGMTVGGSWDPVTHRGRAVVWTSPGADPIAISPASWEDDTGAFAVSDSGIVLVNGETVPHPADIYRGHRWQGGSLQELLPLSGHQETNAQHVADSGLVVGTSNVADSIEHAWVAWVPGSATPVAIPTLGGNTGVRDINDAGQMVGWSSGRAVFWPSYTQAPVILPGATTGSVANAISESGWISGAVDGEAMVWEPGSHALHETGVISQVWDVNDHGEIAIWKDNSDGAQVWSPTTGLTTLTEGDDAFPHKINDDGTVVGHEDLPPGTQSFSSVTAVRWQKDADGDYREIHLRGLGGRPTYSYDINEAGAVVGWGYDADSVSTGYFQDPVAPEAIDRCGHLLGDPTVSEGISDPVNSATGNMHDSWSDADVPSEAWGFDWERHYNSLSSESGIFGTGWSSTYEARMVADETGNPADNDVTYYAPDGKMIRFTNTGPGQWERPEGVLADLTLDGYPFALTWDTGERWLFNFEGRLIEMYDPENQTGSATGPTVTIAHNPNSNARMTVTNVPTGRQLLFTNSNPVSDGLVDTVQTKDGTGAVYQTVAYTFDNGTLRTVGGDVAATIVYTTDSQANITQIESPAGTLVLRNTYDSLGRVAKQELPREPAGTVETVTFSYDNPYDDPATPAVEDWWITTACHDSGTPPAAGQSCPVASSDDQLVRYFHDADGFLLRLEDPFNKTLQKSYDNEQPQDFVDRRGGRWQNLFADSQGADGKGDRITTRQLPNPANGSLTGPVETTQYWDQAPGSGAPAGDTRVWKRTNALNQTTEYSYEGNEQIPRWIKDPAGRITCIDSSQGLVTRTREGANNTNCNAATTARVTTDSFYGPAAGKPECAAVPQRMLCLEVVAPGTADESRTLRTYFPSGRLQSVIDAYGTTASGGSPGATTTTYGYDAAGRVTSLTGPLTGPGIYPVRIGYDGAGRIAWRSEANNPYDGLGAGTNPSVAYTYTSDGQLDRETVYTGLASPATSVSDRDYDRAGRLTRITQGAGGTAGATVTEYAYSKLGRISTMTVAPGTPEQQVTSYAYDADGNQTRRTTSEGTWATGYDFWGRVSCEADPLDTQQFLADGNLNCAAGGSRTFSAKYTYNNANELTKLTEAPGDALERKTEYVYDAAGNLVRTKAESGVKGVTDPADPRYYRYDVIEQRTYDAANRLSQIRKPTPDAWYCQWSTSSGCLADTNCQASCVGWVVENHTYDGAGNLKTVTADHGGIAATTSYAYDDHGWVLSETSPEGRVSSFTYDAAGNVTRMTRPHQDSGTVSQARTFTPLGQLASETDFATNPAVAGTPTRAFSYSTNGWVTQATDPLGTRVQYSYDDRGNRIERRSTQTVGGAPGASCPTPSPTCVREAWAYDSAGQLISHTVPRDATTDTTVQYGYDSVGRLRTTTQPVSPSQVQCETNTYVGHRLDKTDSWHHGSSCVGAPASPDTVDYAYDALDQLIFVNDSRGGLPIPKATTYTLDQAGRIINRMDGNTEETEGWAWSAVGTPVRLYQNDVFLPWLFSHDDLGRLDVTTLNFYGTLVPMVDHTYDKDGLLTHELLNNSAAKYRNYSYFGSGQLKTYKQDLAQVDLVESHLTWRPDGRVGTECTDASLNGTCSGSTETSIYDLAGQVRGQGVGCALSGGNPNASCSYAYSYDGHGNRTSAKRPGATMTYTNNRADQLTQQVAGANTTTYSYDWAGRLDVTSINGGSGGTVDNTYGPRGRLTGSVSQTPGWPTSTSTLRYDGEGNLRAWEINNDADADPDNITQFVWDDTMGIPKVIESVTDSDGTGPNAPVESYANHGAKRVADSAGWYGYDWQGSAVRTSGIPSMPTGYGPFGEPENIASFVWWGYRGEFSVGFEYLHLRNRDYNPLNGRFPTPDPLDGVDGTPTVANRYHYTDNDPLNKVDPLGLKTEEEDFGQKIDPDLVEEMQEELESLDVDNDWNMAGICGTGAGVAADVMGVAGSVTGCFLVGDGAYWLYGGGGGGGAVGSPGFSVGSGQLYSNASGADQVRGWSMCLGASGLIPVYIVGVGVGGEVCWSYDKFPAPFSGAEYSGYWTAYFGLEVGVPGAEGHSAITHAWEYRISDRQIIGFEVETPFGTIGDRRDVVCDAVNIALDVTRNWLELPCRV